MNVQTRSYKAVHGLLNRAAYQILEKLMSLRGPSDACVRCVIGLGKKSSHESLLHKLPFCDPFLKRLLFLPLRQR